MTRNLPTICVTLPADLIKWLDNQVEAGKFANRSHAVKFCIMEVMKAEKAGH